ncbi:MAG: Hpt domain [Solirubrobacteraceae bacterium]|nr:Hpt domain [Solirubrobacteraceae bacterium]
MDVAPQPGREHADPGALVDRERVRSLREAYAEIAGPLVDLFEQTATDTLAELRTALATGDEASAARLAHRLKGSARNVGAIAVAERSAAAEHGGRAAREALVALEASLAPTCAALRAAFA